MSCAKIFREPVNAISHMAGALASVVGLTLLVVFAAIRADAWHVVSFAVFGTTLVLMYTSSFLYHGLKLSDKAILIFRRIDHITIFLLIAGSYSIFKFLILWSSCPSVFQSRGCLKFAKIPVNHVFF